MQIELSQEDNDKIANILWEQVISGLSYANPRVRYIFTRIYQAVYFFWTPISTKYIMSNLVKKANLDTLNIIDINFNNLNTNESDKKIVDYFLDSFLLATDWILHIEKKQQLSSSIMQISKLSFRKRKKC